MYLKLLYISPTFHMEFLDTFPHPHIAGCGLDGHNTGCSTWLSYYLLDAFHAYLKKILQMTHYFYFSFKKLDVIKVLRKESFYYPYPVLTSRLPCALDIISVTNSLGNWALSSLTHCFLSYINLAISMCTEAAQVPSYYLSTAEIQIGRGATIKAFDWPQSSQLKLIFAYNNILLGTCSCRTLDTCKYVQLNGSSPQTSDSCDKQGFPGSEF